MFTLVATNREVCAADSGKRLYSEAVHSRGSGATVPNDLEEPGQDSFFGEIRLQDFGAVVPRLTRIRRHKGFGAVVLKPRESDGIKALERWF